MKTKIAKHKLGWIPDLPYHRDYLYSAPHPITYKLPLWLI